MFKPKRTAQTGLSLGGAPHIRGVLLLSLFALFLLTAKPLFFDTAQPAIAAPSSNLNFQARLLQASGATVPDGNYHVEFKLYDAASSGSLLWTETRSTGNLVRVVNGYLSVSLGSVNAFPGNIDWNEELWLTMNIGGSSGSPSWDGEMSPRLKLTAVPFAFQAEQLAKSSGANRGTLSFGAVTSDPNILLPDASGTVCLTTGNCAGSGGNGDILQGGNSFATTMTIGTNDAQSLVLETNNTPRLTITSVGAATFSGSVVATSFTGNGSGLTDLNATNITTGTIANARLVNSGALTVNAGAGLTGGGSVALGGDTTLSIDTDYLAGEGFLQGSGAAGQVGFFDADGELMGSNRFKWDSVSSTLSVSGEYQVGDTGPAGGTIFFVDTNNQYDFDYLEAGPSDLSASAAWGCSGTDIPGASSTAIGSGKNNTDAILSGCATAGIAARLADNYTLNGYDDWYLPSYLELEEMYTHKTLIGGFANEFYWSSTNSTTTFARFVNFTNGSDGNNMKSFGENVRPIRSVTFGPPALYVDTANSSVGIGTDNPGSYRLNVEGGTGIVARFSGRVIGADAVNSDEFVTLSQLNGVAGAAGDILQGGNSFGATMTIGTNDNQALNLETNNSTRLAITANGNFQFNSYSGSAGFGINNREVEVVVSSSGAFQVSEFQGQPTFGVDTANSEAYLTSRGADSGTATRSSPTLKLQGSYYNGSTSWNNFTLQTIISGTTANDYRLAVKTTSGSEVLTIAGNGNVGIGGDTTPNALFSVGSTSQFQVNSSGQVVAGTWQGSAVGVAYGGTGLTSTPTNGQLLIGNGTGYNLATLTAGTGISITNGAGSITIAATSDIDPNDFIANDTSTQTGNFNIQTGNAANVVGIVQGASNQSADLFQAKNSDGDILTSIGSNGSLTVGNSTNGIADSFTKLSDPADLPASSGRGTAFSPDGQYMSVAHSTSPYITIYKRSGDTFTKLANPSSLPAGTGYGTAWSPDGQYLSVAHDSSPYITIYKRSGDTFTKLADPGTLPTGTGYGTAWSPDGQYMSVAHFSSPYITIYKRNGDTLTKLADPADLPTGQSYGTAWSPDGQYMSVAHFSSPYITIYKRNGDTLTKLADPADLPASHGWGTAWSPDGQYMSVAHDNSPRITIYKRSGDTFTKLADPADLPTGTTGYGTAWSPDGQYMSVAHGGSPYITIYKRSGDTFTKLTNPADLPANGGNGAAWSPDGQYVSVAHYTSPFVTIYKRSAALTVSTGGSLNIAEGSLRVQGAGHFASIVRIGTTVNGIELSPNSPIRYYGDARPVKRIQLSAEYAGAVLDAGTGSDNTGTMTSGVNLTDRMNYYKWTTAEATNQSYDVVVQVPIPADFDGWASDNPIRISTYTSDTTNGTITFELRDSDNSVILNFASVTPSSATTWQSRDPGTVTGVYTAGDYFMIRIRMQSPQNGDVRIGNIVMDYYGKF